MLKNCALYYKSPYRDAYFGKGQKEGIMHIQKLLVHVWKASSISFLAALEAPGLVIIILFLIIPQKKTVYI